jgi:8-oxo-dGTP pyrophosphatase MutT (NUDIX family)
VAPRCFHRDCFPGHFTGSALVVSADGSRALLHHHRKLDRWLQFGGHCDGDVNVPRVAQREAFEESGISGLILASARPFDLDIHTNIAGVTGNVTENTNGFDLSFEDVDGEENGGEFQKVEIEVPVFKVKEGDGDWYHGAYEAGANVTMNKK